MNREEFCCKACEEHRLRGFETRVLRRIKSRRMRWAGHVVRMRRKRKAYSSLVAKPEGRKPLGRPRRRWMDLVEEGWGDVAQDRECGYEPSGSIKCWEAIECPNN
jgi:transposase InsO family protein